MRKTFPLRIEGRHPDRVLDAVKHDIRKYVRRERRRELPEGVDFWDFDCRFGLTRDDATPVHLAELTARLDEAAQGGAIEAYVEILARHGHRQARPERTAGASAAAASAESAANFLDDADA